MTEAEWLASPSLFAVLHRAQGKMSPRKMRLFAVACCRRIEHLLVDRRSREAITVAEQFADGLVDDAERARAADAGFAVVGNLDEDYLRPAQLVVGNAGTANFIAGDAARNACSNAYDRYERGMYSPRGEDEAMDAAAVKSPTLLAVVQPVAIALAYTAAGVAPNAWQTANYQTDSRGFIYYQHYYVNDDAWEVARNAEHAAQLELLREILGNPFHPVKLPRTCLTWNDHCVMQLAAAIYEEQAFDRLPILADALEEAGCTSEYLLAHCRRSGGHIKGCWALDLAMGRS